MKAIVALFLAFILFGCIGGQVEEKTTQVKEETEKSTDLGSEEEVEVEEVEITEEEEKYMDELDIFEE